MRAPSRSLLSQWANWRRNGSLCQHSSRCEADFSLPWMVGVFAYAGHFSFMLFDICCAGRVKLESIA